MTKAGPVNCGTGLFIDVATAVAVCSAANPGVLRDLVAACVPDEDLVTGPFNLVTLGLMPLDEVLEDCERLGLRLVPPGQHGSALGFALDLDAHDGPNIHGALSESVQSHSSPVQYWAVPLTDRERHHMTNRNHLLCPSAGLT